MVKTRLARAYSILLPLLPILTLYGFRFLPFVTFSDYILFFLLIIDIFLNKGRIVLNNFFLPLIVFLLIQPFFLLIYAHDNMDFVDAAGTAWKLALYLCGIVTLTKNLNQKAFLKTTRFIGVASTIYGFFQFFLGTYFHISLSPYLPYLPILRTGLDEQQNGWIAYNWVVRPRAWFSEPSTLAIFLLAALLLELFIVKPEKRKMPLCCLYVFGIIVSRSSTGMIALIILILIWMIICPEKFIYKIPKKMIVGIVIVLPICFVLLYKFGYIDSFIDHTFVNGQGLAAQSHFIDIGAAFKKSSGILTVLFGNGMQDVEAGYLPGWFRTYYCLGVIGVVLYIFGFVKIFRLSPKSGRIIVLTFILLNFGTEIMLGVFMLLYMSVALISRKGE